VSTPVPGVGAPNLAQCDVGGERHGVGVFCLLDFVLKLVEGGVVME